MIAITPHITEKTIKLYKENKVVTFELPVSGINKIQASKFIESEFKVNIVKSNVVVRLGKIGNNRKNRKTFLKKDHKKFIYAKISNDQKLDLFEQTTQ